MQLAKIDETKSTIRFEAKLVRPRTNETIGSWTLLTLPKSASAQLPSRGTTMVEGVINHFPFRAVIERDGIQISDSIRRAGRAEVGDTVPVEITRVGDEPETRVPSDLQKALNAHPKAKEAWTKITPMARRD